MFQFLDLPELAVKLICHYLSGDDVQNLQKTCKHLNNIIEDNHLREVKYVTLKLFEINYVLLERPYYVSDYSSALSCFSEIIEARVFQLNAYKIDTIVLGCSLRRTIPFNLVLNFIKNNNLINVKRIAAKTCCPDEVHFISPAHARISGLYLTYIGYSYGVPCNYHVCNMMYIWNPTTHEERTLQYSLLEDIKKSMKVCAMNRHYYCTRTCCSQPQNFRKSYWDFKQLALKHASIIQKQLDSVCSFCLCAFCKRGLPKEDISYLFN